MTKGRKGKLEIRGLDHRGSYVMCKYLDSKTISLLTPNENGYSRTKREKSEHFITPSNDPRRALLIKPEVEEKYRQIWTDKLEKAQEIW